MANIFTDMYRIRLDHDNIDKIIVLHVNKRFIERVQRKEAFTSIIFHDDFSHEHASLNEE